MIIKEFKHFVIIAELDAGACVIYQEFSTNYASSNQHRIIISQWI